MGHESSSPLQGCVKRCLHYWCRNELVEIRTGVEVALIEKV